MNEEYGLREQTPEEDYQNYLDELDSPRWYLEKTYPTFYKLFKEKFENFLAEWKAATKINDFAKNYTDDLFLKFCRYINAEIEYEDNYKHVLEYIEKNGLPDETKNRRNLSVISLIEVIETVFELPEMIIYTFKNDQDKINKKIDELSNRYGKYDKRIFKLAYGLQVATKESRRSLTDENAIIEANNELQIFKTNELINEYEQRLPLLMKIAKTYSNYWKPKLKNGLEI